MNSAGRIRQGSARPTAKHASTIGWTTGRSLSAMHLRLGFLSKKQKSAPGIASRRANAACRFALKTTR